MGHFHPRGSGDSSPDPLKSTKNRKIPATFSAAPPIQSRTRPDRCRTQSTKIKQPIHPHEHLHHRLRLPRSHSEDSNPRRNPRLTAGLREDLPPGPGCGNPSVTAFRNLVRPRGRRARLRRPFGGRVADDLRRCSPSRNIPGPTIRIGQTMGFKGRLVSSNGPVANARVSIHLDGSPSPTWVATTRRDGWFDVSLKAITHALLRSPVPPQGRKVVWEAEFKGMGNYWGTGLRGKLHNWGFRLMP